jgi:ribonuclease HII
MVRPSSVFSGEFRWTPVAFSLDRLGPLAQNAAMQRVSSTGPTRRPELKAAREYGGLVAGVDEAGRGPWAGPVVAAAVIFTGKPPQGIDDSKKLAPSVREDLYEKIRAVAVVGVGISAVEIIDDINIYHATHAAMLQAVAALTSAPAAVLVDGNRCPKLDMPAKAIVGGDAVSVSIAAASIIAKVTRDRIMTELAQAHPDYGFERHKGYGTRQHALALRDFGVTAQHRRSFRPVWERAQAGLLA